MLFRKTLLENRVSGGLPVIYFCFFWLTHLSETSYNFSLKWQHFTFWMGVERKILSFWGKKSFLQFCKKLSFGKLLYFEVMHKICWKHLFFIDIYVVKWNCKISVAEQYYTKLMNHSHKGQPSPNQRFDQKSICILSQYAM